MASLILLGQIMFASSIVLSMGLNKHHQRGFNTLIHSYWSMAFSVVDWCFIVHKASSSYTLIILVYVDDLIFMGNHIGEVIIRACKSILVFVYLFIII